MKREILMDAISHLDIDLIENYFRVKQGNQQLSPSSLKMVKNKEVLLAIVAIAILIICIPIVMKGINRGEDEKLHAGVTENSESKFGCVGDKQLKYLNAEEIEKFVDYSGYDWLISEVKQDSCYPEIYQNITEWIEGSDGAEGFILTETTELSVSTYNMPVVDLSSTNTPIGPNVVYQFLFEDRQAVGYIWYLKVEEKLSYSLSLNTMDTYGYYFDFLAEHPKQSFIVLADGYRKYFLSDENVLYNARTGEVEANIPIEGDCYHAFDYEGISVSYEKIVNEIEPMKK